MPVREREIGELPSPICPCSDRKVGQGLNVFGESSSPSNLFETAVMETFNIEHSTSNVELRTGCNLRILRRSKLDVECFPIQKKLLALAARLRHNLG